MKIIGHKRSTVKNEVLAVPPLFLQESGHSGGIPVASGIYTGMFPGIGRNGIPAESFICLLCICDE